MSMSSYVLAFRDLDGEFRKMAEVKAFCDARGVSLPKEVEEYFGKYSLDPIDYAATQMSQIDLPTGLVRPHKADMEDGFEIEVAKIPKEVKFIRFVNSY